ncbi:SMI1/KNR4 family protein [Aquimarina longa]|uniref:SMI1/KNR4 family protein n=1 Tax=Aquimarina longa TaxID=1080221 RepID=UPI0007857697|nr:SMI1/KNR4 family protein [Aquimarina longa]
MSLLNHLKSIVKDYFKEKGNELEVLEKEKGIKFPLIYKEFYKSCKTSHPKKMRGTDLFSNDKELMEGAIELLEEDNAKNFLTNKDFVFMMHQGYMFWYFKADGNENPDVYFYQEQSLFPDKKTDLKSFLENLT